MRGDVWILVKYAETVVTLLLLQIITAYYFGL